MTEIKPNTKFEVIYSNFLNSITDYRIKNIFEADPVIGTSLLQNFLKLSIPDFYNCKKLQDTDMESEEFSFPLSFAEETIITNLMVITWWNWNNNNITISNLTINDNDFRHHASGSNLKARRDIVNALKEDVDLKILNYGLSHTPFNDWGDGNYERKK